MLFNGGILLGKFYTISDLDTVFSFKVLNGNINHFWCIWLEIIENR